MYPGRTTAQNVRTQGVRGNSPVAPKELPKVARNTLVAAAPVEWLALRYGDADGNQHDTLALRVGGQFYLPPERETEAWVASFGPPKQWLQDALVALVPARGSDAGKPRVAVPTSDVDFTAAPSADENA